MKEINILIYLFLVLNKECNHGSFNSYKVLIHYYAYVFFQKFHF